MPKPHDAWLVDEPHFGTVVRHVIARARHRPFRIVIIAAILAGALVANRLRKPPIYQSTLYFHLLEGEITTSQAVARPPPDIRHYITTVVLTSARLIELMQKYGMSRQLLKINPQAAVAFLRDDIGIDVSRNYFTFERSPGDPPREATVTISFGGPNREVVEKLVLEIRDLIISDQTIQRANRLAMAREHVRLEQRNVQTEIDSLSAQMAGLREEAQRGESASEAALHARTRTVFANLNPLLQHREALERRLIELQYATDVEGEGLGLSLELFDKELEVFAPPLSAGKIVWLGLTQFSIMLILVTILVGAFDRRIYGAVDLKSRGLPVFGALPRFRGDDEGSYRRRGDRGLPNRV